MSLYEWLLVLHVLAAFLLVGSAVSGCVAVFGGDAAGRVLGPVAGVLGAAGGVLTLIFGVWLVIEVDGYEIGQAWIIVALILWLVSAGTGSRVGQLMKQGAAPAAVTQAKALVIVNAVALLLLLYLMIYKPGV